MLAAALKRSSSKDAAGWPALRPACRCVIPAALKRSSPKDAAGRPAGRPACRRVMSERRSRRVIRRSKRALAHISLDVCIAIIYIPSCEHARGIARIPTADPNNAR
eukprot:12533419-Heterocapsa_arctica.AAC.1